MDLSCHFLQDCFCWKEKPFLDWLLMLVAHFFVMQMEFVEECCSCLLTHGVKLGVFEEEFGEVFLRG